MKPLGIGVAASLAVLVACSGGGEPGRPDGGGAKGEDRPADDTPGVALPADPWARSPVSSGPARARAVIALEDGFLIAGVDQTSDAVTAWTSADGSTWETHVVEAPAGTAEVGLQGLVPSVAARLGDRVVLLGGRGGGCGVPYCSTGAVVAWVSDDAGATWRRAQEHSSFSDEPETFVRGVVATGSGFVAVGETHGPTVDDWTTFVWRSTDGAAWELATRLTLSRPVLDSRIHSLGDRLVITAGEAFCAETVEVNGFFWALSSPFAERPVAWISDDGGGQWNATPLDDLPPFDGDPLPNPLPCDDAAAIRDLGADLGDLHATGDRLLAVPRLLAGETGTTFITSDFVRWEETDLAFSAAPASESVVGISPVEGGLVAIEAEGSESSPAYTARVLGSIDGRQWKGEPEQDLADPPPPREDATRDYLPLRFEGVAVAGGRGLIVAEYAVPGSPPGVVVWVSAPPA